PGVADEITYLDGMVVDDLSVANDEHGQFEFPSRLNRDRLLSLQKPEEDKLTIKSGNPYGRSGFMIHPDRIQRGLEYLQRAQYYVENNDPERVRQQIVLAMQDNLDHPGLLQKAAALAATIRLYDLAGEYFALALEGDPENPDVMAALAGVCIRMGDMDRAAELLRVAESLDDRNLAVMLNTTILALLNDTPETITPLWGRLRFQEMVSMVDWLEVDKDEYTRVLGDTGYTRLCDYVMGAGTAFSLAEIRAVLENIAHYTQEEDTPDLIAGFRLLLELGVDKLWVRMRLAEALLQEEQQEEGVNLLTNLAREYPDSMIVLYNLGYFLMRAENYTSARHYLLEAHRLAPSRAVVSFWLACAYVQTGETEKAWPLLSSVVQHDPAQFNRFMREGAVFLKPIMSDPRFKTYAVLLDY
ncbi:MAG: tetratricopeptide repeat protein, partial [Spartobacteria bacterium]|nr:tetratricopeptide repeat protein [Spartobacteria bacterium]